jgi:hypothetical protein
MTANVSTMSFKPTGTDTSRSLGNWTADIFYNVKNFGAVGDNSTDDTVAIQACFDAAFGPYTSPHALDGGSNVAVFFPPGAYKVSSRGTATITNVVSGTGGVCRLTLSASLAAAFGELDPVMVSDVTGTVANNTNGLWFIHLVDSTHVELLGTTFSGSYTSGGIMNLPCLKIRSLIGCKIFGNGRFNSGLTTASTKCAVLSTNGFAYNSVSDMGFFCGDGGVGFDLNWVIPDPLGGSGVSLQSNKFEGLYIAWSGAGNIPPLGKYGLAIGGGGNMGSENVIINCYISGFEAALVTLNGNALQQTVIGGNMAQNNYGVYCPNGTVEVIEGVGFQNQQTADINLGYSAGECTVISGCRDENGAGFLIVGPAMGVVVMGCSYAGSGSFYIGAAYITIIGCRSTGNIGDDVGHITIMNSIFTQSTYLTAGAQRYLSLSVFPQVVTTQTAATYTMQSADGGSQVLFNRATGQTVTVPKSQGSGGGLWLEPGAKIEVQQIGAGQTTFVAGAGATINSSNGLKLRAQYSCATLILTSDVTWTLTGDTAV